MENKDKALKLSYEYDDKNRLVVSAEADEVKGISSGLLELKLLNYEGMRKIDEAATGGPLPLSCGLAQNISPVDKEGNVYYATAFLNPDNSGTPQSCSKTITVEGWKNRVLPSCSYTVHSKVSMGSAPECTLVDTVLTLSAAPGYAITALPRNAKLEYVSVSGTTHVYSGQICYSDETICFKSPWVLPDNDSLIPDLRFSCTVKFGKIGKTYTQRDANITLRTK